MPPTITTQRIWSTTWHRSKGLHWIRPMITSMFSTYRSELQGITSKLKLHAIPKQDRNTVLRTKQEQTIITNHLEIRLILLAVTVIVEWQNGIYDSSFLELLPPWTEFKWCSQNTNDHHQSSITDRIQKNKKLCKPLMGGTRSNL